MAINVANSTTYDSGAGNFFATHTVSSFTTTGTDPYLVAISFQKNPATEVTAVTADGSNMTKIDENLFNNVASIQAYGIVPSDGSQNIVVSTPTFKECSIICLNINERNTSGVYNSTTVKGNNFSTNSYATITGTSGSLLIPIVATQADVTFTASNCTSVQNFSATSGIGGCFVGQVAATGSSQTNVGATVNTATNWRVLIIEFYAPSGGGGNVKKINIGDSWKDVSAMKINIGDSWKTVQSVKINVGDSWKTVF